MGKFANAIKAAFCCVSNTTAPDPLSPRMHRRGLPGTTRAGVSVKDTFPELELDEQYGPQFLGKRTYTENLGTTSFFNVKPPAIVITPVDAFPERDLEDGMSADDFAKELAIKVGMRPRSSTFESKLPNKIVASDDNDIEAAVAN